MSPTIVPVCVGSPPAPLRALAFVTAALGFISTTQGAAAPLKSLQASSANKD